MKNSSCNEENNVQTRSLSCRHYTRLSGDSLSLVRCSDSGPSKSKNEDALGVSKSRNEAESGCSRSVREEGGRGNGNKPPCGLASVAVLIEYMDSEEALLCGIMGVSGGGRTIIWGGGDTYEVTETGKECGR